jgi:hypothetical protein
MKYRTLYHGEKTWARIGMEGQIWIWDKERGQVTVASSNTAHVWAARHVTSAPKVKDELIEKLYRRSLIGYKNPQMQLGQWGNHRS